ncbi:GUN4 domain-containing protein [Tolypothrix sp. NIES-4075]|uniref:caspase, EACC1-associated type n=1 Tax=Tolypothrix sp. NIES-4075 TaxID=2005459 RepID=UPI000B768E21|nr:GUN4 domain-containing protein [Tolypothrix sp. NIES-4075]
MAKYALLIGISEYQSKPLKPLPGVVKDIEAMQRVLQDSKTGGFDEVKLLTNPDSDAMRSEIEQLFMEKCQTDDIVLLYFSGHGYRDEDGNLFFVSHNTQINPQGGLRIGTAVDAKFIHERYMGRSKSKRQVLILDCCFSGAFAEGMSAKEAVVVSIKNEIEAQLGGEGRAVLTSSTAAQVSFEDAGGGVYTRYLVEGIEKGAADSDNDGVITIDELHEYAKRKAQESKPAMKPEIYAVREGYKIRLANAPLSAELGYRKEVEECVKNGAFSVENNSFSNLGRRHLDRKQTDFKLDSEKAAKIEEEVLQPIRDFQQSLQEYEEALTEALKDEPVLSDGAWEILKRYQQSLKLRDEDVAPIQARFGNLTPLPPFPSREGGKDNNSPPLVGERSNDDLSSEKGIDYTKLRDLLKAGNWKEADYETYLVMIQAVGKKENDYFERDDLLNFPCTDLRTIDRLWVKYSDGRFGFTVQKQIYISLGGKADGQYYEEAWDKFSVSVGWKIDNNWIDSISNIKFDTSAPEGHLPFWGAGEWLLLFFTSIVSRIETCKL